MIFFKTVSSLKRALIVTNYYTQVRSTNTQVRPYILDCRYKNEQSLLHTFVYSILSSWLYFYTHDVHRQILLQLRLQIQQQ